MAKALSVTELERMEKGTLVEVKIDGERWLWRKIWNGTGYSWDAVRRMERFTHEQIAKLNPKPVAIT